VPDFAMRSTWTRCRPNCCRWSTRRSSRPRPRCGFDHRRDRWGVAEGESPHPIRHERLHAMQFRGSPPPQVMDRRPVQPPDSSDRDCPPDTAGDRCLWHAGGTAGENDSARTWPLRLQLDCLVRPDSVTTASWARAGGLAAARICHYRCQAAWQPWRSRSPAGLLDPEYWRYVARRRWKLGQCDSDDEAVLVRRRDYLGVVGDDLQVVDHRVSKQS
jgi:hypothetical protein